MSKTLKGKMVITRPQGPGPRVMSLQLSDENSSIRFLEAEISYEDFVVALTAGYGDIEYKVRGLENLGKKLERKRHEFPFDRWAHGNSNVDIRAAAVAEGLKTVPEGWFMSESFSSRDSFDSQKKIARTQIFRYVELDED